jgi:hypothetical protein
VCWFYVFVLSLKPLGEGSLYAAQIGGVGFHSFPGEGARAVMMGYYENN